MKQEKKICFCFTARRVVLAVLLVTSLINLLIVGAVVEVDETPTRILSQPSSTPTTNQSLPLTQTGFVPTATVFETLTPASTSTEAASPTPSPTSTDTATATGTPTVTLTHSPTPTVCAVKTHWHPLYVQRGDTLYSLALATGSTVNELMQANCLTDTRIYSGQPLYVPRLPIPTFTPTVTLTTIPPTETSTPTIFLNPSGNISLCFSQPYIYFSVRPIDPEGIKSVTVFYRINSSQWSAIPMSPDGEPYYASANLSADIKIDFAYYYFSALDGAGNFSRSNEYIFTFPPCPEG